jgi:predicted nucleic acid-binding protein
MEKKRTPDQEVHVPHLIDYEFRNAVRGLVMGRKILAAKAEGACLVKEGLPLVRHAEAVTGRRAWDLRENFNAYDATYVALAEALGCRLVTCDEKIARSARAVGVDYIPVTRS